jgi:hypothetical protein
MPEPVRRIAPRILLDGCATCFPQLRRSGGIRDLSSVPCGLRLPKQVCAKLIYAPPVVMSLTPFASYGLILEMPGRLSVTLLYPFRQVSSFFGCIIATSDYPRAVPNRTERHVSMQPCTVCLLLNQKGLVQQCKTLHCVQVISES